MSLSFVRPGTYPGTKAARMSSFISSASTAVPLMVFSFRSMADVLAFTTRGSTALWKSIPAIAPGGIPGDARAWAWLIASGDGTKASRACRLLAVSFMMSLIRLPESRSSIARLPFSRSTLSAANCA